MSRASLDGETIKEILERFQKIVRTWGRSGPATTAQEFADQLGVPVQKLYSLRRGFMPRGRVDGIATLLESLRSRGADPRALAAWVFTGHGEMPSPSPSALVAQPETRDPAREPELAELRPASPVRAAGEPPMPSEAVRALQRALEAEAKGEDPLPLIQFAADVVAKARVTFRQAKQLGLAVALTGAGLAFSVLPGRDGSRNDAKIAREALALWAEEEERRQGRLRVLRGDKAI